jgi:hypothetical protein
MRGRVYATWNGLITLAWMICYATIGSVTDLLGPSWTIALAGLIVGLGGPLLLVLTSALAAVRATAVPSGALETA